MQYILAMLLLTFVSCIKKPDPKPTPTPTPGIVGKWSSACETSPQRVWQQTKYQFDFTTFTRNYFVHLSANCSSGAIQLKSEGTYTLIDQDLDLVFASVHLTPLSIAVANFLNAQAYCEYTGWVVNEFKDVTGRTCGSDKMRGAGEKLYDLVSTEEVLLFGDLSTGDGKTPDTRPTQTDAAHEYQRESLNEL